MDEIKVINKFLTKLAYDKSSLDLKDDVFFNKKNNLVISTDGSTLDYNCKIYTWSAGLGGYDFDNPVETTGNIGYTNCYNELISWNFHN